MKKQLQMRLVLAAIFAVSPLLLPGAAQAQKLKSTSAPPVVSDPVPGKGADFSPSDATATEAYGGPPKAIPDGDPCTPFNPCALASSAPRALGPLVSSFQPAASASHQARAQSGAAPRRASLR
jgi:hypothetical protein